MKKARLIINPIAGTHGKESLENLVMKQMQAGDYDLDVRTTRGRGDAAFWAKEAVDQGYYAVVAAGGDGTVNEIAGALCGAGTHLGIIPCGSGNGLARHIGIPLDIAKATKIITGNHHVMIDYAEVNGKKFFCTCGLGFDAAVSDIFANKKRRGLLSYIGSVREVYSKFVPHSYSLQIDGKELEVSPMLIAVCNTSQYGNNAYISPKASISDGQLDITIIYPGNVLDMLRITVDLFTKRIAKNRMVKSVRCTQLQIESKDEGLMHLDGEPMAAEKRLTFKCMPAGLSVFVP